MPHPSLPASPSPTALPPSERSTSAAMIAAGGAVLVGWNAALNLIPFPAWAYVPANLALAGAAVLGGRAAGLSAGEMGLVRRQGRGLLLGLGVAAVVGGGLLVALRVPAAAPALTDQRATGLSGLALLYGAAIRIPLGTAIPEEVIFRGVLFGALRRRSSWWAAACWSSAVFGLWHIGPTIVLARINGLDSSPAAVGSVVAGAVAATSLAGVGFCLLRRWGGGVLAPIVAHTSTNALSLLAAVAAQRAAA